MLLIQKQNKPASTQLNQGKKPMPIWGKAILIYISSVILGLVASSLLGKIYRFIQGQYIPPDNVGVIFGSEAVDTFLGGFIWGYLFFVGLFSALFIKNKSWAVWLYGFILLGWISLWEWKYFFYSVLFSLLGFLIGKLILFIKNKAKK